MIRARFTVQNDDYRPVVQATHPFWCTGYNSEGSPIVVAYADSEEQIKALWPDADAIDIMQEDVDHYTFTDRFPKPDWLQLQPPSVFAY